MFATTNAMKMFILEIVNKPQFEQRNIKVAWKTVGAVYLSVPRLKKQTEKQYVLMMLKKKKKNKLKIKYGNEFMFKRIIIKKNQFLISNFYTQYFKNTIKIGKKS